ncbi:MAG: hypothetical protein SNJ56_01880 [Termitinemataceae bacterium]
MMKRTVLHMCVLLLFSLAFPLGAENFRTTVKGSIEISTARPEGKALIVSYVDSVVIFLGSEAAFIKGVELEIKVPSVFLKYRNSVALAVYSGIRTIPNPGIMDFQLDRRAFEVLPAKLQTVYQIPLRPNHGLKSSPYVSVLSEIIPSSAFPILLRFMPVVKGLSDEIENLEFTLTARPIIADEGALRLSVKTPDDLSDKPYTILIDNEVLPTLQRERILKTGEHTLTIHSDFFRTETRNFIIERGKILNMTVNLRDTTPSIQFEVPDTTKVFLNEQLVDNPRQSIAAEPGQYTIRFQVGDYSLIKQVTVMKGKNYKIALTIDVSISEE